MPKKATEVPDVDMEMLKLQVEVWKKVVQTQEHFNDLELRIRNFAILLVAAFLGIGGYALKEGITVPVLGINLSLAGLIVLSSLLPWKAFYLMDKFWYDRLLKGSVNAGIPIERELAKHGLIAALGENISKESQLQPVKKWWLFEWSNKPLRSDDRMDAFYALVTRGVLLLSGVLIAFGLFSSTGQDAANRSSGTLVGRAEGANLQTTRGSESVPNAADVIAPNPQNTSAQTSSN